MYVLYTAALWLLAILGSPLWLYKLLRHQKYRTGLGERLGSVPDRIKKKHEGPVIWIHAVSVGEAIAVSQLIQELQASIPGARMVVSTTTVTGQQVARDKFGAENVFYFPLEFGFCIRP